MLLIFLRRHHMSICLLGWWPDIYPLLIINIYYYYKISEEMINVILYTIHLHD